MTDAASRRRAGGAGRWRRRGRIDILAAIAGIYPYARVADADDADWDRVMDINVKGALHAMQACLPAMRERGYGRIVLTSSITGPITGQPGFAHYGASKAAMLGFMRSAAVELATEGVTVNAVMPGNVAHRGPRDDRRRAPGADAVGDPDGRLAEPEDVAGRCASWPRRRRATSPGRRWSSTAARCCPRRRG